MQKERKRKRKSLPNVPSNPRQNGILHLRDGEKRKSKLKGLHTKRKVVQPNNRIDLLFVGGNRKRRS
jgi:hypothetical protein